MIRDYEMACKVLGVTFGATEAEIKSAYRELAKRLHPDNHPQQTERIREAYRLVVEAYDYIEKHPAPVNKRVNTAEQKAPEQNASKQKVSKQKVSEQSVTAQNYTTMSPQAPKVMGSPVGKRTGGSDRDRERKQFEEKARQERESRKEKLQEELQERKAQLDQEKKEKAILNEIRAIRLAAAIRAMLNEKGIE